MTASSKLEQLLINLGKDNKPTFVAMGVATAKGIFRPIFTMADTKQDKDVKKYTAIREGLTELIAIPVYWGSGKVAEVLSKKLAKPKDMPKDVFKKIIDKDHFDVSKFPTGSKNIRNKAFKSCTTLSMLGVFLSALLIIPAVCSATIKPLMKVMQKPKTNTPDSKTEIAQINVENLTFKGKLYNTNVCKYYQTHYAGMKVG